MSTNVARCFGGPHVAFLRTCQDYVQEVRKVVTEACPNIMGVTVRCPLP